MKDAFRAAKVALFVLLLLAVPVALVFGIYALAYRLLGNWGIFGAWLAMIFVVFWFCALLDIRSRPSCCSTTNKEG